MRKQGNKDVLEDKKSFRYEPTSLHASNEGTDILTVSLSRK
jgi:hypothetical protein